MIETDTQSTPAASLPWPSARRFSLGLPQRIVLFVLLFAVEWIPLTYLVHKDIGAGRFLQVGIVFSALFGAFAYARIKPQLEQVSRELERIPIGWAFLLGHFFAYAAFVFVSYLSPNSASLSLPVAASWIITGVLAIALNGFAFVPPRFLVRLVRGTGWVWVYALSGAAIAWRLARFWIFTGAHWEGTIFKFFTDLTFHAVNALLHLILSEVVSDRSTMLLGAPSFQVRVLAFCSGIEGMALMLVFSVAWLIFFRRELRFPRALLLVPASMAIMWITNAIRITVLILIGVAGAKDVAANGFHSEAGWIAFNCVALGFALTAQRLTWFKIAPDRPALDESPAQNPTLAYLLPFLAILAAAMIARAASAGFEWLYPLRFVAAAAALWVFRSTYKELDWRFGWVGPAVGGLVFALWLALDSLAGPQTGKGIADGLAALPPAARIVWLIIRTAAAVITVPIAEELAFRGFLIRRLIAADFESRGTREYTYVALLVSSLAFGLMHGDRWIAGTVAGLLYAAAMLWRGRIGDAVVAHATTNAMLAIWVLSGGRWDLW